VGALAHRDDRRFRRAQQLADLGIVQFRIILEQPGDGVGPVLALADRRVACPARALRQLGASRVQFQARFRIRLATGDLFTRELAVGDRVEPANPDGDFAVGDALNL
jgi:hypothetical protein